ncbi:hypothetical protein [Pseudonocardia nigra]|uniref:hypothetical protein n=1 Tax=Pseudonocardia nigra TaxID=1921578 RepID=UPI001C5FEA5B|nr:hypothetical protein [Pseudonocardia nigra]
MRIATRETREFTRVPCFRGTDVCLDQAGSACGARRDAAAAFTYALQDLHVAEGEGDSQVLPHCDLGCIEHRVDETGARARRDMSRPDVEARPDDGRIREVDLGDRE